MNSSKSPHYGHTWRCFFAQYPLSQSCLIILQNVAPSSQSDRAAKHAGRSQFNYGYLVYLTACHLQNINMRVIFFKQRNSCHRFKNNS